MKPTTVLRQLIHSGSIQIAPGVFDGLSARLVEQAQFPLVYASGGAIARSSGYPDLGILSVTEIISRIEQITDSVDVPVIADADTGYGNEINVARTVKQFERAGVAAIHLEDQQFPKRCGHLNDKRLISLDDMVLKLKVARDHLSDDDFVLIARTDAIAVEGFEAAITRAKAYLQAGADMIFVEAPQTVKQIETIAAEISQPKLINMFHGGKTPMVPASQLQQLGYSIIIIPSDLQRAAMFVMQQTLAVIKQHGDSASIADQLMSFQQREVIIGTEDYLKLNYPGPCS